LKTQKAASQSRSYPNAPMTNPVVNANNLKSRSILAILMAGSFLAPGAWAESEASAGVAGMPAATAAALGIGAVIALGAVVTVSDNKSAVTPPTDTPSTPSTTSTTSTTATTATTATTSTGS